MFPWSSPRPHWMRAISPFDEFPNVDLATANAGGAPAYAMMTLDHIIGATPVGPYIEQHIVYVAGLHHNDLLCSYSIDDLHYLREIRSFPLSQLNNFELIRRLEP